MVEKTEIGIYLLKIFYPDICLRAKILSRPDEAVPLVWKVIRFARRYLKGLRVMPAQYLRSFLYMLRNSMTKLLHFSL